MNKLDTFNQIVAETMNEAFQESAADLLNRCVEFGMKLDEFIMTQSKGLPDVMVDGLLLYIIQRRHSRTYELAKALSREHDGNK